MSAGRVVGQGLVARKGMEMMANKSRSSVNSVTGIVAQRKLIFEPGKHVEGKAGVVKLAVQAMEEQNKVLKDKKEPRIEIAKPGKIVPRKVVVASRKNGKRVTTVCSRIDDFMEKTKSKPFGEGAVKGDKGENKTARKRARGE